jgi:hypothetical protein
MPRIFLSPIITAQNHLGAATPPGIKKRLAPWPSRLLQTAAHASTAGRALGHDLALDRIEQDCGRIVG